MPVITRYDSSRGAFFRDGGPLLQKIHRDYGLWIFNAVSFDGISYSSWHSVPVPRYFKFYNLSQMLSSRGWLWIKGKAVAELHKDDMVMMTPDVIHDYNGSDAPYDEDCFCFAGVLADNLARCGIIAPGRIAMGKNRRLLPIIEAANNPGRDSQIRAAGELHYLLTNLYLSRRKQCAAESRDPIEELIERLRREPTVNYSVTQMAEMVRLSVNQFIRRFSTTIGVTPKKYVESLRVAQACDLLKNTSFPVNEVARSVGFHDPFHFSRWFRALIGESPSHYRSSLIRAATGERV